MSRIVVLYGGESTEHEVSLASGQDVIAALRPRHEVVGIRIDKAGRWHPAEWRAPVPARDILDELGPDDVVFPVLHGGWGENGGLQRELEARGIPFVGCGSTASETGMSKLATARAAAARGVRQIPVRTIGRSAYLANDGLLASAIARSADFPLVVKPNEGGSSVGVHVVHDGRELRAALDDVFTLDETALLQPLVSGQEVSVGVWQDAEGSLHATGGSLLHLPSGEETFSYAHKYDGAGGRLEIPAAFPPGVLAVLQESALRAFSAIGAEGLSRVDFFVHAEGVVLNEVNTMPGLRRESHFPRLVAAAGTDYETLLDGLVALALARRETERARLSAQPSSSVSPT